MIITLKIKKLNPEAILPKKAHKTDTCWDMCACLNTDIIEIPPHKTVIIHTGLAFEIPKGYWCPIYGRSGKSSKEGCRLAQGTAVIDEEYRGEVLIPLHNDTNTSQYVKNKERICQFGIEKRIYAKIEEVEELSETERNDGGLGSSGKF